jgi:NADPH-dependent 2,4-dienoyl-CoA reductase/sulfur reductase-like enzyme
LTSAPAAAAVSVVGAGPSGIRTAAELAEEGRTVTLVCGGVLGPYLHPWGRRSVARRLATLGVTVLEGPDAKVTAVTRDAVRLGDGRKLPSKGDHLDREIGSKSLTKELATAGRAAYEPGTRGRFGLTQRVRAHGVRRRPVAGRRCTHAFISGP